MISFENDDDELSRREIAAGRTATQKRPGVAGGWDALEAVCLRHHPGVIPYYLLEQVRGEAVSERVWGNPIGQPSQLGGHVADAIELARRHRVDAVAAGEHPHLGMCDAPPVAQQLQQLWRQHGMAILAAFALLHPDHHALGINVADLQRDQLHGAQTRAVGNA
jgi:hypothetical protein